MLEYFINFLLPSINHLHILGYWLAFFAAFLETTIGIGLFLPGSTIILALGAFAAQGYLDVADLLWFAVVGAVLGDNINYYLGKRYGSIWIKKGVWFLKKEHFVRAKNFFNSHGARSVFWGRFIPTIKEIVPFIAGSFKMKRKTFLLWNVLGAVGWGLEWTLAGYIFARSLNLAEIWLSRTEFFVAVLLFVSVIFYFFKLLFLKKGKKFFTFLFSLLFSAGRGIVDNPEMRKVVERHPAFFKFLTARINKNNFFGLPLTILALIFIYIALSLAGIVGSIIGGGAVVAMDVRVANLLAIFRNVEMTKIFFWITLFGKWQVVAGFVIAVAVILCLWRRSSYVIALFLTIIGSEGFTGIGKHIFHRPRPEAAVYAEHSFSFPSGHATIAVAFYGFLTYILLRHTKRWKIKVDVFFIGLAVILLIGFSRLYLGVHYLSDVWAGYLVGVLWIIVGIGVAEWLNWGKEKNIFRSPEKKKFIISGILILVPVIFYFWFARSYNLPFLRREFVISKKVVAQNIDTIFFDDKLKYTETLAGNKQEPLNFVIIAVDDQRLISSFRRAGWFLADKVSLSSAAKIAKAALLKQSYPAAPMTPSFWNSQVHNFGFEKATGLNNVRQRHHARFWKTNYMINKKSVYVGTASFDSGLKWGVTHRIKPDIDTEQEFLFHDLQAANVVINFKKRQFVEPGLGKNFAGDLFFTDGKIYVIEL